MSSAVQKACHYSDGRLQKRNCSTLDLGNRKQRRKEHICCFGLSQYDRKDRIESMANTNDRNMYKKGDSPILPIKLLYHFTLDQLVGCLFPFMANQKL